MSNIDLKRNKMVDLIERNKISSVEVADALNKTGVLPDIRVANPGHFVAGTVEYVYAHSGSNYTLHKQIESIEERRVVYVDAVDCDGKAIFGDLVAKYLYLYKRAKAVVVNGLLRDFHRLRKENYPLWFKGATPLGCINKHVELPKDYEEYFKKRKALFNDSILVCDDSGCTLIGPDKVNENFYKTLEFIEIQEDIWYYCVDVLKWSTYDVVCQKKYLEHPDMLPEMLRKQLEAYNGTLR